MCVHVHVHVLNILPQLTFKDTCLSLSVDLFPLYPHKHRSWYRCACNTLRQISQRPVLALSQSLLHAGCVHDYLEVAKYLWLIFVNVGFNSRVV